MAFNLGRFLGGMVGLDAVRQANDPAMQSLPPGAGAPLEEDQILVTGTRPSVRGAEAPMMGNTNYQEEAQSALEAAPQRKGLFGTKGTLRDILGIVGDAFLVQSGNKPVYAPQREREQMGDAMSGFTADPTGAMERMAYAGYGDAAAELQNNQATQQLRAAQQESLAAGRQSMVDERDFKRREAGINRVARWARGGVPYATLVKGAAQYGIDEQMLAEMGVTPDMTDEQRRQFAAGDTTVYQQEQLPLAERRVAASESQAQSSRIRAERPPQGRSAPQPTSASIAAPLLAKVQRGERLTAGEEETLRRTGYSPDRGRPARRGPPALPPRFQRR